jgi:dipeptidyl aminopeptidase/acylaminoacyl peptidase
MADVLALADAAAARPGVDSTRQVLMGTGYGATLAAWIVSQTDRFEAAVAHQGTYALPALVGDRAWRLVPDHFGGYPWDGDTPPPAGSPDSLTRPDSMVARSVTADSLAPRAALIRNAPLTYVDSIRTPLLLMHAAGDPRASASHTERLYRSLKILERPVELVRYPAAGSDTPMRHVDRLVRTYEFLARYARPGM